MIRDFAAKYFSQVLLLACIAGFFVPDFGEFTPYLILVGLFNIIFTSYFQLDLNFSLFVSNFKRAIRFSLIRLIVLPIIVYFVLHPFSDFYAFAIFFVFLMPSGGSSPAITHIANGNINLSVVILVFSSFFATFSIPSLSPLFYADAGSISPWGMLRTVMLTIILPFFIHLPFRRSMGISNFLKANLPVIALVNLSFLFLLAISINRKVIFENLNLLAVFALVCFALYLVLYALGWYLPWNSGTKNRVTYSISSGLNNVGLALSLSLIHFEPIITVFLIVAEIVWVIILIPVKAIFAKLQ